MERPTSPTAAATASQASTIPARDQEPKIITTEEIFAGLTPYYSEKGSPYEAPYIPLKKMNGIIGAISVGFDEDSGELRLNHNDLEWLMIALSDLAKEVSDRLVDWENGYLYYRTELRKRLDACRLVQVDPIVFTSTQTTGEV